MLNQSHKLALWSFWLSLFSLFGYIFVIFAFAPVGAELYLFLHTTSSDFLSTPILIFLKVLQFATIAAGVAAIVSGILALFRIKNEAHKGKVFAILGILIGFLAVVYHTSIVQW